MLQVYFKNTDFKVNLEQLQHDIDAYIHLFIPHSITKGPPRDEFMCCEVQTCSLEAEWRNLIKANVYSKIQNLQREKKTMKGSAVSSLD